jgi:hypothetical protein
MLLMQHSIVLTDLCFFRKYVTLLCIIVLKIDWHLFPSMWASSQIQKGKYTDAKCDEKGFCTFVKYKLYCLTTSIVKIMDQISVLCLICNWMRAMEDGVLKVRW